ncbi:hypothetical protein AVEN_64029-1 [Araneus ventricosus]|uniref:Uncharacterized protein n=1 Tax=Araneus ventricosus TaxID=182803 RepID=A0A4Y2LWP6_ARAVE|nr:hypothetical protein AVEN_64029-1 [Araneus ventricosus]
MEAGQEEMRSGQEQMKKEQEEMMNQIQAHAESQIEGSCKIWLKKIEVVQAIKGEIEDLNCKVQRKIEEVEGKVQDKINDIEKRISELEDRSNNFPASPEILYSRPTVKLLMFDGLTLWSIFKTQFDVVSSTNG